jgi:UDP:flavonoid glycosyltransferase YjiC (YdhE family)
MAEAGGRVLVVTWAGGGNVLPLQAAAGLLAARGFAVEVLASAATQADARRHGLPAHAYRRAPQPDMSIAFEADAPRLLAQAAGVEVARDVHELAVELRTDLLVADCMLPAALAAGEAASVPTASLVHFPYALARSVMARGGGAWTTDRATLDATRRALGLPPSAGDLDAWESPELLLVTVPRWFDAPGGLPAHIVHAGPLGVRTGAREAPGDRRVLLAFSTTVMEGQQRLVANACAAVEEAGAEGVLTLGPALDPAAVAAGSGVEVVEWGDHDALMRGCDAVVTHGGLGTTLRALAHGRPLVVLPLGRDQHFNAQRVEDLGAGLRLPPDAPAAAIAAAIARVLAEPGFADVARRAARMIAAGQPDRAAADALARVATGPRS